MKTENCGKCVLITDVPHIIIIMIIIIVIITTTIIRRYLLHSFKSAHKSYKLFQTERLDA